MKELDLKDRKLLYWLDQDSRATNKHLAKKVGLTEQAIGYKLKKLQDRGVLLHFITFVNTLSLGYYHYKVFLKLHNTTQKMEQNIIQALVHNSNIRWVTSTSGRYDLSFSVVAKTPLAFSKIYDSIESSFGKYIIEKNIAINIKSPGFTRAWLIDEQQSKKFEYMASKEEQIIDENDDRILKSISQNSRKNIVDIAQEIHSTVDVVKYRIKKLKEKKIISGFTIQLDLEKLGYEYYTIFLRMQNLDEDTHKRMIEFATLHPNILYVVKVIGSYDMQLELETRNFAELDKILSDFRHQFSEYIRDFELLRVTKEYKYNFYPFE